jgi:KipI family sensor histidine kinase inhibitor
VTATRPRILPVGDAALTVELGRALDPAQNARVRAMDALLRASPFVGLLESVPAFASLLVVFDPARCCFAEARAALEPLLETPALGAVSGRRHVIPVAYGGDDGPDLADVARACGLSEADVVARHTGADYTALFSGFLPGFAYLGTVAPDLERPRRESPRPRVPAGSVAVAGRLTGVYPFASPGGWNLIGRTGQVLFDPLAPDPALIQPGDRVRFARSNAAFDGPVPRTQPFPAFRPAIEVLEGGLLTTIQDDGRHGHRRLGVPWCGALDGGAARAANGALGNAPGAATLECTALGPVLRFLTTLRFAVAGADLGAVLERADLGAWPVPAGSPVVARAGNVLTMRERRAGLRAWIAVAGGIDVLPVLGSRATDLVSGFGGLDGRALAAGDALPVRRPAVETAPTETSLAAWPSAGAPAPAVLRVVLGPQDDMFTEEALAHLARETYEASALSDRTGCRLTGPRLTHRGAGEILTDGMVPGCIQVPPSGQPIVLLRDGPTTGGYPKIATVITADLDRLAQIAPGDRVRFRVIAVEDAPRPSPDA